MDVEVANHLLDGCIAIRWRIVEGLLIIELAETFQTVPQFSNGAQLAVAHPGNVFLRAALGKTRLAFMSDIENTLRSYLDLQASKLVDLFKVALMRLDDEAPEKRYLVFGIFDLNFTVQSVDREFDVLSDWFTSPFTEPEAAPTQAEPENCIRVEKKVKQKLDQIPLFLGKCLRFATPSRKCYIVNFHGKIVDVSTGEIIEVIPSWDS